MSLSTDKNRQKPRIFIILHQSLISTISKYMVLLFAKKQKFLV